jgi:hypothetical protein
MALRLFLYMGQMWDTQRREWQDRRRPIRRLRLRPIIPVVYYTGERRWAAPLSLKQMMDLPAELERFVPEWETLFLNLRQTPPETLTRFASAVGWALRVLQAEQAPLAELERVLTEAMIGLEGLSAEQAGQWRRVVWFLMLLVLHEREEPDLPEWVLTRARQSRFSEREEIMRRGKSILEQAEERGRESMRSLVEQAEERGRESMRSLVEQAEEQGEARALRTVLAARFGAVPAEVEAALAAADLPTLTAWLERAATAGSLEEVGIPG